MTIKDRIKDLETQLGISCLTIPTRVNGEEPVFFKFQVPVPLFVPDVEITVHKSDLSIKSIVEEIIKASYVAGCNNGIIQGNKQIVSKFKTLFEI